MPSTAPLPFTSPLFSPPIAPAAPKWTPPEPNWRARTQVTESDHRIAALAGVSPVCAAILRTRGLSTASQIESFLWPSPDVLRSPHGLPDVEKAVARLQSAILNGERLLIFGDYDVDGITSTALLLRSLKRLGANVSYRLPERAEGYGLSVAAIEEAHARGFSLVLSADCGITAIDAAKRARELGLDLIITDHHEPGAEIPDCVAVVNPKRHDSTYGFTGLSGCGVAFKTMQALIESTKPSALDSFNRYLDLVALSTIADCVPLVDENRFLASRGLELLYETRKKGLLALIEGAGIRNEKSRRKHFVGRDVSFGIAPRINAAGRLDSPTLALRLLLSEDEAEIRILAEKIENLNSSRRFCTEEALAQAEEKIEREANLSKDLLLVADGRGWNRGVVGLLAAKLVEKYGRPAFALGVHEGHAHGSGRTCANFDLHALVEATRPFLTSGGGHAAACGLSLSEKNIPPFREAALEFAGTKLDFSDLTPTILADCQVGGDEITLCLAQELARLEPCGTGNEPATLLLRGAHLQTVWPLGETHIKGKLRAHGATLDWIWWRGASRLGEFSSGDCVDLIVVPEVNDFRGQKNLQLVVKDAKLA